MKRFWKAVALLALAGILLAVSLGGAEGAAGAQTVRERAGLGALEAAGLSMSGETDGARVLAKSKKKKTTATPTAEAVSTPTPAESAVTPTPVPEGPITDPQSIADYLFSHNMQLPENFITKEEAQRLGWRTTYRYVSDAAPGKSIGGDHFSNYERTLPTGKGITYQEADCYYTKGTRNAYRVIYSSDGRVWYTEDHYNTFTELFPTGTQGN